VEPDRLFVYGSLMYPEVLVVLLDRVPDLIPTVVTGWSVRSLDGQVYPGLIPASDDETATGLTMTGLSPAEWHVLDTFESPIYTLDPLQTQDGDKAWAYVAPVADCLPHGWDGDEFRREHLTDYVSRCQKWRAWYRQEFQG
jgi:gamma-glutamylcyclotransferase (GGCT)/AIG2-like uncharacterized protein YtfP